MCYTRLYDVISVAVSLLIGVVFGVLSFLNLLVTGPTIPILALALGFFGLAVVAYGHVHGLRCMAQAPRLIISALILIAVAIFALVFAAPSTVAALIITFLLFSLMAYVLFSLFCFLTCREKRVNEIPVSCR